MLRGDSLRLRHMLDAACDAVKFTQGRSRRDLEADRMFALALVKCIEIVGEAAAGVSGDIQRKNRSIPWADIVEMRHRLVHGYFAVDMDRVWDTVTVDLPSMILDLEKIVASVEEDS